jgi:hypothetical protein
LNRQTFIYHPDLCSATIEKCSGICYHDIRGPIYGKSKGGYSHETKRKTDIVFIFGFGIDAGDDSGGFCGGK